jgi:hypothetical protein
VPYADVFNVFNAKNPALYTATGTPTAWAGDPYQGEQRLAQLGARFHFWIHDLDLRRGAARRPVSFLAPLAGRVGACWRIMSGAPVAGGGPVPTNDTGRA